MKKTHLIILLTALFGFAGFAFALPIYQQTQSMIPARDSVYDLGTTSPANLRYNGYFNNLTVSGTCTGCGGGGSLSGGTAGMLTSWVNSTTVTATGTPTAASYFATSTTATSTFAGGLNVAGSSGLTVLQNGNIGISNTNPGYNLDVNGSVNVYNILRMSGSSALNIISSSNLAVGGSNTWVTITYGASARYNIFPSGNIGVGTSTPYTKFAVSGSSAATTTFAVYGFNSQTAPLVLVASTTGSATSTAFIIDSNGKVGIGTTSPYTQLSVTGNIAATGLTLSGITGSTQCLRVDASGTVSGTGVDCGTSSGASYDWSQQTNTFSVNSLTPTTTMPIWIQSTATSTFAGGIESWGKIGAPYFNATSTTATSTFAGGFKIGTGVSAVNFLTTGSVGVGTTTPTAVLSVHSNAGGQTPLFIVASSTNGAGTSTAFYIAPNGTIGVGTNPVSGYQFTSTGAMRATQLYGTSQISTPNLLMINPGTVSSYASFIGGMYASNSAGTYPFNQTMNLIISPQSGGGTARDIVFAVGSTTATTMVVQGSTNNIGIGTTSPFAKLSVSNASSSRPALVVYGFNSQTAPLMLVASTTGSATSTAFIIDNNGQVGIGTSTPWRTLSVQGSVSFSNLSSSATGNALCITTGNEVVNAGGATCVPSSIQFKENVKTLSVSKAEKIIKDLKFVSFDYKKGAYSSEDSPKSYGLIAEDVFKTHPELVDLGYDKKPRTIFFEKFIGVFGTVIQNLLTITENHEARITKLEKEIELLKLKK